MDSFSLFDLVSGNIKRPKVARKPWMDSVEMRLATAADLDTIAQQCIDSGLYALDLETTGLDARSFRSADGRWLTNDKIVGYCIAPTDDLGWYVPVRHKDSEHNVPPRIAAEMIRKIQESGAVAVFHNAKFDHSFLDGDAHGPIGDWDNLDAWECTYIQAYLRNSRGKRFGLKGLAKSELDMEMIELKELFSADDVKARRMDFSTLDPTWEPTVWYAASDAICTRRLHGILNPVVIERDEHNRSQKTIYRVEKGAIPAARWMERNRIHVDRDKLRELIRLGQREWFDSLEQVYAEGSQILGRNIRPMWFRAMQGEHPEHGKEFAFDPDSMSPTYMESRDEAMARIRETAESIERSVPRIDTPDQYESVVFPGTYDVTVAETLGLMFREMGVPGLILTEKSGQIKTSKDVLERIIGDAGEQFPFMARIKRFRETAKALSTNLFPILRDTDPEKAPDGCMWIGFNGQKVDTGRYATPSPRKGAFHGQTRFNLHSTPATYDKTKPECMRRTREVISARPGHVLFAIDYSGVELRIVANLSRESKWLDEFFRCSGCEHTFDRSARPPHFCPKCGSDKIGDLHTLTAFNIFGDEIKGSKQFKQRRQEAKGLNFAMCYGGGPSAAQRSVGVSREEGFRIKRQFDKGYRGLVSWWKKQHLTARRQKYVTTAYGRKYPLPDIDHVEGKFRSKAERNSVNGPVQGSSADIMKLAMALLYREFKKRGWLEKVLMTITIHDELVFEIHESLVDEAVSVIERIMCDDAANKLGWPIFLKVDVEFGDDWTVPYNLTEMAHNKGGGDWDERLATLFPSRYRTYIEAGGTPVGDLVPEGVDTTPAEESAPFDLVIATERMTPEYAEKLARILKQCAGRGSDRLRVVSEAGDDLLGGTVSLSRSEFDVLARSLR